mgnify:CR=1 FL=1
MGIKLDGVALARKITNELKDRCNILSNNHIYPTLTVVISDPNNMIYANQIKKRCKEVGINVDMRCYDGLNIEKCHELAQIQNPIIFVKPIMGVNEQTISKFINPVLDVDGWSIENIGRLNANMNPYHVPCTAKGILKLLLKYNVEFIGKKALVIGRSNNVGRPVASLLEQNGATVTVAHSDTDFGLLYREIKNSDIIISCVGKKDFVTLDELYKWVDSELYFVSNMLSIKIIVDVGGGDFDEDFKSRCLLWTPDKGCIGPMTTVCVCDNVLNYYEKYF